VAFGNAEDRAAATAARAGERAVMALDRPKRTGLRFGGLRVARRYLIAVVLLALVNLFAFFFFRDGWDSTAAGRFILPILGQGLLFILAVAAVAALVAGIKILLARNDG
jgi:hypothetical protein